MVSAFRSHNLFLNVSNTFLRDVLLLSHHNPAFDLICILSNWWSTCFIASSLCVTTILEHADDVSKLLDWDCVTLLAMLQKLNFRKQQKRAETKSPSRSSFGMSRNAPPKGKFLSGERCVTFRKTAAEETSRDHKVYFLTTSSARSLVMPLAPLFSDDNVLLLCASINCL